MLTADPANQLAGSAARDISPALGASRLGPWRVPPEPELLEPELLEPWRVPPEPEPPEPWRVPPEPWREPPEPELPEPELPEPELPERHPG